jgi:hypothetical protein
MIKISCRNSLHFLQLLVFLIVVSISSLSVADHGADAYTIIAGTSGNYLPPQAMNGKGHIVKPNSGAMKNRHITFQFPNGTAKIAHRKRIVTNANGQSWVGKFDGEVGGTVILSKRKGLVSGIIDDGNNLYELIPGKSGNAILFQVDPSKLPPFANPVNSIDDGESGGGGEGLATTSGSAMVQDILIVYTSSVKSSYDASTPGTPDDGALITENAIQDSVIAVNTAYIDSQVNIQLNLVHMAEVSYSETGDMGITLSHLRSSTDGFMDNVHTLRNTYSADLVAMISNDSNYCGIAYLMQSDNVGFAPYAFSVTGKGCLSGATLDHELGHNQGNCHNREETQCSTPAYDYGYGLCGSAFRTIMSYSSPCGSTRIRNFSNPNVSYLGNPTGIDHDTYPATSADSARTMNNTAGTVAQFRASASTIPNAPSGMSAIGFSDSRIDLTWTDNSSDETGFVIERSTDNTNWAQLATIGANTTATASYSDTGLPASTLYWYQVKATNSAGSSSYSNPDSGRTNDPPLPPETPSLTASAVSGERIDLSWNNVSNQTGYRIERSLKEVEGYSTVANPTADSTSYSDTGLNLSTLYYYHIYATNNGGDSGAGAASASTFKSTEYTANSEVNTYGSVSGSYANTQTNNDSYQSIVEQESGGKKRDRHSRAEHRWQFNLGAGSSATLYANAWKLGTSEDDFIFEYSTNGSSYQTAFTVTSGSTSNDQHKYLNGVTGGTLYVRVKDTDSTPEAKNLETIRVDHLYVAVTGGDIGDPPVAPTNLNAIAVSASQVDLGWTDAPTDEIGFMIERSTLDGTFNGPWVEIGASGADTVSYSDTSVIGATSYEYQIRAYNAAGVSTWGGPAAATTPAGLVLSGNGYKQKGQQKVQLDWTGGGSSTAFDVFRDNFVTPIHATSVDTSDYLDPINTKGGGSYTYRVCVAMTPNCSNDINIVF